MYGPEGKHFVSGLFFYLGGMQRSCDERGGARSALFGVLMSPKRRVRAAHGRAREANNFLAERAETAQKIEKSLNESWNSFKFASISGSGVIIFSKKVKTIVAYTDLQLVWQGVSE